jgi:NTP pyrophosphatase (non-canonical NTP hydrolase)
MIDITIDSYQDEVEAGAITKLTGIAEIHYTITGCLEELGEIASVVKKATRDKQGILSEEDVKNISKEIGDLQWYINKLTTDLKLRMKDILIENVIKVRDRVQRNVISGSGDNR